MEVTPFPGALAAAGSSSPHSPGRIALGFSASKPFIGTGRNNFSHGGRIIFKHSVSKQNKGVSGLDRVCRDPGQKVF
jgi:hypothetical protein